METIRTLDHNEVEISDSYYFSDSQIIDTVEMDDGSYYDIYIHFGKKYARKLPDCISNGYTVEGDCIKALWKKYKIVFKSESEKEVNTYCENHSGCGVIDIIDNMIYVCEDKETK